MGIEVFSCHFWQSEFIKLFLLHFHINVFRINRFFLGVNNMLIKFGILLINCSWSLNVSGLLNGGFINTVGSLAHDHLVTTDGLVLYHIVHPDRRSNCNILLLKFNVLATFGLYFVSLWLAVVFHNFCGVLLLKLLLFFLFLHLLGLFRHHVFGFSTTFAGE